ASHNDSAADKVCFHGGDEVVVGPAAEEADLVGGRVVVGGQGRDVARQVDLAQRFGDGEGAGEAQLGWDVGEEVFQRLRPNAGQHGLLVFGGVEYVGHADLRWVSVGSGREA